MIKARFSKKIFASLLIIFCLTRITLGENKENKLKDALNNNTKYKSSNAENSEYEESDNIFKTEAQKLLKQCGVETNNSDSYSSYNSAKKSNEFNSYGNNGYEYNNMNKRSNGNNGFYGSNNNNNSPYGQNGDNMGSNNNNDNEWNGYGLNKRQSNYGNQQNDEDRYLNNNRYNNQNRNNFGNPYNQHNNNRNQRDDYPQNNRGNSMYGSSSNNQEPFGLSSSNTRNQDSTGNRYDTRNPIRSYNSNDDCKENGGYGSNMFGYNPEMTSGFNKPQSRQRRYNYYNREDNKKEDTNQCVSQCIFGYLHLLDEDRTPSETIVIKWLQEHFTGNDMDRINALRDVRRCFGRLTTSDIEDGCEFSKELGKCLELDLE